MKLAFRFFFIYFLLTIAPWYYLYPIPGAGHFTGGVYQVESWIVETANRYILHVKDTLNANGGGSGDTSYAWAQLFTYLIIAVLGSIVWAAVDRKKNRTYPKLEYGLITLVRYFLAMHAFGYGIIKLFALQMPFPNLSQLATPLGDYLPMRLSWMFMGYSTSYQQFAGLMEVIVGVLLMYRKTATLGAAMGAGVFANVFVMNISYDIPVKIFSLQLMVCALFLLAQDWRRLANFFFRNTAAEPTSTYDLVLTSRWTRIARIGLKALFIFYFALMPFYESRERYQQEANRKELKPIRVGVYDIETMIRNRDTVRMSAGDYAWKDFIFDYNGLGSVNTLDSMFRQRYRRGYFTYQPDTVTQTIGFKKFMFDTTYMFRLNYRVVNDSTLALSGAVRSDSIYLLLHRSRRHFQLAERQFHWLSEANR